MVKLAKSGMGKRQQRISDFGYREQKGSTRDTACVTRLSSSTWGCECAVRLTRQSRALAQHLVPKAFSNDAGNIRSQVAISRPPGGRGHFIRGQDHYFNHAKKLIYVLFKHSDAVTGISYTFSY